MRYGALFLVLPGTYAAAPPLAAWVSNNAAPHTRRATAIALLTTCTNSGGILSTWLLGTLSAAPQYTTASAVFLAFQLGMLACAQANVWYLGWANRTKAEVRALASSETVADAEQSPRGDGSAWFKYTM